MLLLVLLMLLLVLLLVVLLVVLLVLLLLLLLVLLLVLLLMLLLVLLLVLLSMLLLMLLLLLLLLTHPAAHLQITELYKHVLQHRCQRHIPCMLIRAALAMWVLFLCAVAGRFFAGLASEFIHQVLR